MINLLPDDQKRSIRAARMNVVLLRYNFITLIAIGALGLFCGLSYVLLNVSQSSATNKSETNTAQAAKYISVKKQADEYAANLLVADQILGRSVNYTSVIFAIANLMPSGVILDNITLNASDFNQQLTFSAKAKTTADATRLKDSFQKSSIFTNVYLQSVTDSSGDQAATPYPIEVSISAKLGKVTK